MNLRIITLVLILGSTVCRGQDPFPLKEDVSSIDGIIKAYYEVVSGPDGPKQTERDKSLHHATANVMVSGMTRSGEPFLRAMTLKEFHANMPPDAFYETEVHRITEIFGTIAHVWSTYEHRNSPEGEVQGRGINSIQLYNDGERWWILNWVYDSERNSNPISQKYLPD